MSGCDIFIHSYYITIILSLIFTLFCTFLDTPEGKSNFKLRDCGILLIFLIPIANYFLLFALICFSIPDITNYYYKKFVDNVRKSIDRERQVL